MNKVWHSFNRKSTSQILFATAIVFVRDKYGQLANCCEFLDSAWQDHVVRQLLVQLLHFRRFKARVPVQGNLEVTRAIHYAPSLDVISWFSIWEPKRSCTKLPKLKGMQEYEYLHHMNQNNEDASSREERYYVQRRRLYKSSESTSHTRVVLDVSCRSSRGLWVICF